MDPTILENFDGKVRLFPLPNVVLFPRVIQPLHIFFLFKECTANVENEY